MSSKITIFLTADNEHCFEEGNEAHYVDGKFIGNTIYLEMDKKNVEIVYNNKADLIVSIKPGSELYKRIKLMKE